MPLYAVYALLFRDSGLTVGEVSSLFLLWSAASFLLEVPSGAWADTVDRRSLLVISAFVYAAGFSCWLVWPTYAGFAAGFVLWGLSSALMSGTFEALLYDDLTARGCEAGYPRLIGWCHSSAMAANLVATVAAAPLMAWGGYPLAGWASVAIAFGQAGLAWSLPTTARERSDPAAAVVAAGTVAARYLQMLHAGLREAGQQVEVRRAVVVSALVIGLTVYDEYFSLVARDHGVGTATVPVLVGLVVAGQLVGTALAGRTAAMSPRTMGRVVFAAGSLIAVGSLVTPVLGFAAIAVGYGLVNNAMVVSGARLQQVITGPARATVTSVAGLSTEVVALAGYLAFAVGAGLASVSVLVALLALPTAIVSVVVRRCLPPAR